MNPAVLALEDGTVFEGSSFGAPVERTGEVVFNTAITGYQEVFTDPSYSGQIVVLTYPQIGNYGSNEGDNESAKPHIEGLVVREFSPLSSNWRADETAQAISHQQRRARDFRNRHAPPGAPSALARRDARSAVGGANPQTGFSNIGRARPQFSVDGRTRSRDARFNRAKLRLERTASSAARRRIAKAPTPTIRHHVVAYDFGIKRNILRRLVHSGCRVTVVPAGTTAEDVLDSEARRRVSLERTRRSRAARLPGPADSQAGRARRRSSASAWVTRSWGSRWEARPTSSSSATAARIIRC